MIDKLKSNKLYLGIAKSVSLIILVVLTYVILSWIYTGALYGLNDIDISIDSYDKINISDYFKGAHDLYIDSTDTVTSLSSDPWFAPIKNEGKRFIVIYINKISNTTYKGYTTSQFYLKSSKESQTSESVVQINCKLYEGWNLIDFGTNDYDVLRFDITTEKNCTIEIESVSLTDKFVFPKSMWAILLIFTLIYVTIIFFSKPLKQFLSKFFVIGSSDLLYSNSGIFKRGRLYWIFVTLAVMLGYGFALTNTSVGIDDLMYDEIYFQYPFNALRQGRWVMYFLKNIFDSYSFLQWWRGLIGIIIAVVALTIWCHLFEKCSNGRFSDKAAIIFTMLSITCPYVSYVYVFNMCTFEYGLKYLITGIVLLMFYNSMFENSLKKRIIQNIGIILLLLLVGGETIYINLFIGLCEIGILVFLFNNEDKKLDFKKCLIHSVRLLILSVLNLLIFKIIARIYMYLYNVKSNGYTSNYIKYDSSLSIWENAGNFIDNFNNKLIRYLHGDLTGLLLIISIGLIIIIGIIYSVKKKNALIFVCSVGISILPFTLMIFTGNVGMPKRTLTIFSLSYAFVFALIAVLCDSIRFRKYKCSMALICLIAVVYITVFQTKVMNEVFVKDYNRYQADVKTMNDIETELIKANVDKGKPVLFIGYLTNTTFGADEVVGASIFMWDRKSYNNEIQSVRIKAFFKYHGYFIKIADNYDIEEVAKAVENAPVYPNDGYVIDCDDYIIVNLGANTGIYKQLEKYK